jgi:hypothetical protein
MVEQKPQHMTLPITEKRSAKYQQPCGKDNAAEFVSSNPISIESRASQNVCIAGYLSDTNELLNVPQSFARYNHPQVAHIILRDHLRGVGRSKLRRYKGRKAASCVRKIHDIPVGSLQEPSLPVPV